MKKFLFWILGISCVLFIAGAFLWIFEEPLKEKFFTESTAASEQEAKEQKPKRRGVTRKVSYIGRIREAKKLMEHEYYNLATVELSAAIRERPEVIEPYLLLGEIYIRTNDNEKLTNLIAELKTKFSEDSEVFTLEARQLINKKDFESAVKILNSIGDNLKPSLKFYRAILLALQNDHETAQKILRELEKLPVEERTLEVSSEGVREAEKEKADSISPEIAHKANDISIIYDEFEQLTEGKNPHLFVMISKALAKNNEAVLALEFAEVAIKEDIEYIDAWILRGYANYMLKDMNNALEDLYHAYELDPIRAETHYFLALALQEAGREEEATLFFEKSLEHQFEFSNEVRWKLVDLFTKQEKYERVLDLYKELLAEESDPKDFVQALHIAVDILDRPETALEITQTLIEANPEDVVMMNLHAWALIANRNFSQAEIVLKQSEVLKPENPRTFLNFGLLYEEQGLYSKARKNYRQCYELGKDSPATSITNLAAEKYNELLDKPDAPIEIEIPDEPKTETEGEGEGEGEGTAGTETETDTETTNSTSDEATADNS